MILQYISHTGKVFDLKTKGGLRARSASVHTYNWDPKTTAQQYGAKVDRFDKKVEKYKLVLDIGGGIEEKKAILNELHAAFDSDIFAMSPGKLVHGDYYILCYISKSTTSYTNPYTTNEVEVYCPYPFWIKENTFEFLPQEDTADANTFLEYEYGFDYDYMSVESGQGQIRNPGAGDANFRVIVYGPAIDPVITIDSRVIGVYTTIAAGEYLIIDSRDNTVIRRMNNGEKVNLYNSRVKTGTSIFDKISSGIHSVIWAGTYGFDFTVFEERSEPAWS